ncbi:MAG: twin transmembrane helix small protein [Rhodospirillales bacterium]
MTGGRCGRILESMQTMLPIVLGIVMFLTLAVLFVGVIAFAFSPGLNARYGNKFMRWRVILQGVALLVFGLMVALSGSP